MIRARVPDTPDSDNILSCGEGSAFVDQGVLYNVNQHKEIDGPRIYSILTLRIKWTTVRRKPDAITIMAATADR